MSNDIGRSLAKPEWADAAVIFAKKALAAWPNVPAPLKSWWLIVLALRLMRGVSGSDRETLAILRQHVEENERATRGACHQ